jgi:hypothetical protein
VPGRLAASGIAVALFVAVSYGFFDRPFAAFWETQSPPAVRRALAIVAGLGDAGFWLPCFAFAWLGLLGATLVWKSERLAAYGIVSAFALTALATSSAIVRLLMMAFGRFGPSFFLHGGSFGFDWFQFKPIMLSFPAGHAQHRDDGLDRLQRRLAAMARRGRERPPLQCWRAPPWSRISSPTWSRARGSALSRRSRFMRCSCVMAPISRLPAGDDSRRTPSFRGRFRKSATKPLARAQRNPYITGARSRGPGPSGRRPLRCRTSVQL